MSPESSNERDGAPGDEFRDRLRQLKARGSVVLVVGEVPSHVCVSACERLLGEARTVPRHRLLVFTNGRGTVESRLHAHDPGTLGETEAITAAVTRSARPDTPASSPVPVREFDPSSLAELGGVISGWIEETEVQHGPLAAGELRLCLDSLLPLLDEYGKRAVFEFTLLTAARVRAVTGMGHFHLPARRDSEVVQLLAPATDAMIELRLGADGPQQRWLLDGGDIQSPWLSL